MAATASSKRKSQQRQAIFRLLVLAAILVGLNLLAARFHTGADLTQEKRFTLSPTTVRQLRSMDDVAVIEVYLKGKDFPVALKRLADATREELQAFKEVAGNKILFRFTDPLAELESKSEKDKQEFVRDLAAKGIFGGTWQDNQGAEGGYSEKTIFPWALVNYKGRTQAVNLVENHLGMGEQEVVNTSESLLEYKLANAIHQLARAGKPSIAYIVGHGENLGFNTFDALKTLSNDYRVDTFGINENIYIPRSYAAIIINKPTLRFEDKEKFKIDQYVMNGGKVLWFLDMVNAPLDSLGTSESFLAQDYGLNLDDLLFRYGVRVNADLIEDIRCNRLPVAEGVVDDRPQIKLKPWIYFPLFQPTSHHSIVNNMDMVMSKFASSIDTTGDPDIKKTVLLESSQYSRVAPAPFRVSLSVLRYPPKPSLFNKPYQPVAVLLEGRFESVFRDRLHPQFLQVLRDSLKRDFKPEADSQGAMIVVSDGDIISNDFTMKDGPFEMGYWRFDRTRYANKTFLLNCLQYLTDPGSPLDARSKNLTLRLLDGDRVRKEQSKWQLINIVVPLALVLVFASVYLFFRKRRYEGAAKSDTTA